MAADGTIIIDAKIQTDDVDNGLTKMGSSITSAMKKIGSVIATAFALDNLKDFGLACIEAASDADAASAQFTQVFGDLEDDAAKSLKSIASEAGISENRMKGSFTKIAAFAKTTGMDTSDSLDLANRAMVAVADSAAFYDRSLEETTESLQSFLKGNYENDAALGLSCTETTRNEAANKLYGKSFEDLSEAQKQLTLLQMVEDANELSGALGQAARESDTWTNVTGNLQQAWTDFQAVIGSLFLDVAIQSVKGLANIVQKMAEAVPVVVEKLSGLKTVFVEVGAYLASTFSPVLDALRTLWETLTTAISSILAPIASWVESANMASGATGLLQGAIQLIADVLVLVINGITNFINAIMDLWSTNENFQNAISSIWGYISSVVETAMGVIKSVIDTVMAIISGAWEGAWKSIKTSTTSAWSGIKTTATTVWNAIKTTITTVINAIKTVITTVFNAVKTTVTTVHNSIKTTATTIWTAIKTAITTAINAIKTTITTVFNGVKTTITTVWNAIKTTITTVVNAIKTTITTVFNAVKTTITTVVNAIKTTITTVFNAIKTTVTTVVNAIKTTVTTVFNTIKSTVTSVVNSVKSTVTSVFNAIKSAITSAVNGAKSASTSAFNGIKSGISSAMKSAKSTVSSICSSIKTTMSKTWNSAKSTVTTVFGQIGSTMKSKLNSAKSGIVSACSSIKSGMKNAFSNVSSIFRNIGSNVINGIKSGISGAVSGLYSSIKSALSGLVSKAKSALGIASPSRVFRDQVGKMIPAGITVGLKAGFPSTLKALQAQEAKLPALSFTPAVGIKVPHLASGAVIPSNSEFLAVLGDQKSGTNIEAPLDTIKQAMRQVLAEQNNGSGGGGSYTFTAQINRRTLFDEMITEAQLARSQSGRNPFEMA